MTHVTCRLTAKNRDQLRNPTLGNRVMGYLLHTSTLLTTTTYFKRLNLSWQFVLHASLLQLFREHGSFWNRNVSEGSVATCARLGRIFSKTLLAYLLENLPINNFKNPLRFDGVAAMSFVSSYFGTQCILIHFIGKTSLSDSPMNEYFSHLHYRVAR